MFEPDTRKGVAMKRRVSKRGFIKIGPTVWMKESDWLDERCFLTFATESPKGYLYIDTWKGKQ